jgi:DNA modification methylase
VIEATWNVWNEDCVRGMAERLAPNSVHLTVTSIPFEELFTYSGKLEDVGNNGSTIDVRHGRFALNMRFVIEQLFRVTAAGCNVCIHIQQLLAYKVQHGFMGRRDFRGAIIDLFRAGGFEYKGEAAIPKNPQTMAQRLNLHSLQFKTGYARSSTDLAPAVNDFLLIFQKPGDVAVPVRCLKNRSNPHGWLTTDEWVRWASGCWTDILEIDVLDGWKHARESDEEKHVCPLQLELIRRCVLLYTNPVEIQPDVTVLDPFMGIGSTAHICLGGETLHRERVPSPRNVVGFELKESYHLQAEANCRKVLKARATAKSIEAASLFADDPESDELPDGILAPGVEVRA